MNPAPASIEGEQPARLRLTLERDRDAPAVARAAIAGFCEGRNVDASVLATLMLLVSEIVTNAVIHPDAQPSEPIGFAARLHRTFIRIEVTDQGSGFTPQPRDPLQVGGGYGLFLLEAQARDWGVDSADATTVWFEVDTGC